MDNRGADSANDGSMPAHYIAKRNTVLSRIAGNCDVNTSPLRTGALVEAVVVLKEGGLRIRVCDPSGAAVWRKTEWLCHRYDLIPVSPNVWRYLAAVPAPQERIRLASDKEFCSEFEGIRVNSRVWFCQDSLGADKLPALVKFIGPVPELGPGFYFGLEVPNTRAPPQHFDLAQQYFSCSRGSGVFSTLSNLRPFKAEALDAGGTDRAQNTISKFPPSDSSKHSSTVSYSKRLNSSRSAAQK